MVWMLGFFWADCRFGNLPSGQLLITIVENTLADVWSQYDSVCNGGIYWSRDRNSIVLSQSQYKSTITYFTF